MLIFYAARAGDLSCPYKLKYAKGPQQIFKSFYFPIAPGYLYNKGLLPHINNIYSEYADYLKYFRPGL